MKIEIHCLKEFAQPSSHNHETSGPLTVAIHILNKTIANHEEISEPMKQLQSQINIISSLHVELRELVDSKSLVLQDYVRNSKMIRIENQIKNSSN